MLPRKLHVGNPLFALSPARPIEPRAIQVPA
jgi:hypothetical protein